MNEELKRKLREQGQTGLDLSPGDPIAKEALDTLERLEAENIWLRNETIEMTACIQKREKEFEQQMDMMIKKQNESDREIDKLQESKQELLKIIESLKDVKVSAKGSWY